ncbi:glycine cleavage system protein GcvH [Corynebacterium epidermidicanis]|uniref:Glycine cleavage system H protein n=1 Tax=Corynebacterium epidermidicanis TaxID=1050174 RepID=A0A0G3GSK6_9CORY|nr:glycine cleavage system protein GcvH [Corynebacterium epidermidicanis]AKK03565.1 glycine cleavage system H protein [Corynebacterium epidermidicanis]
MSNLPESYSYSADHEWISGAEVGATVKLGITDFAANALGEIVYVDLPAVGDTVEIGETCGEVESTKSVSDLFSPVNGTVVAVNDELADAPETINSDPFEAGWLFEVEITEVGPVMTAAEYAEKNGI